MSKEQVQIRVVEGGEIHELTAGEGMVKLTDAEIIGFASESIHKELSADDFVVDRTDQGIVVRPRATYG